MQLPEQRRRAGKSHNPRRPRTPNSPPPIPPNQGLTVAPHLQVQPWKRLAHFAGSQAQNFSQKLASPAQGQSALQAPSQAQGKYWGHICSGGSSRGEQQRMGAEGKGQGHVRHAVELLARQRCNAARRAGGQPGGKPQTHFVCGPLGALVHRRWLAGLDLCLGLQGR
jgi:hypothetical protein